MIIYRFIFCVLIGTMFFGARASSQEVHNPSNYKTIFAVVNDGSMIEPIAFIEDKKLVGIGGIENDSPKIKDFVVNHYKPKTSYKLIFGGKEAGTVIVNKGLAESECAANQAEISVRSKRIKPRGFVMALATNAGMSDGAARAVRKLPSYRERRMINRLVLAEMRGNKVRIKSTRALRSHNLTKIDVDDDGNYEFVGTFYVKSGVKKRSMLFFIAQQNSKGKITIPYSEFGELTSKEVMSGEISHLDEGIYHELLLDSFDVDSDGTNEIFTMQRAFEGSNFFAYKRINGKWTQILSASNYHCGF